MISKLPLESFFPCLEEYHTFPVEYLYGSILYVLRSLTTNLYSFLSPSPSAQIGWPTKSWFTLILISLLYLKVSWSHP